MRILVISQYFWPESFRVNDLCKGLKERGHDVVVLTGKPNYPHGKFFPGYGFFNRKEEDWEGIKVYRASIFSRGNGGTIRLFLNYLSFAFFASIKVFFIKEKFDKIFVYQLSPVLIGIPSIFAKKRFGAEVFFYVQDLWPESITAAGNIKNRYIIGVFNSITKFLYKNSKYILMQSRAFKSYIIGQGVSESKLIYLPNSTEPYYKVLPKDENLDKSLPRGFRIMFAGNIGEAQSFDTLLMSAKILKDKQVPVKWIILGDGRMRSYVEQKIRQFQLDDVFFLLGSFPTTDMPGYFSCADVLLVSLKKHPIFNLTIPSKVQSYLACGKPLLGSLDGEGARIIQESGGMVSDAENDEGLAQIITDVYNKSENERIEMGLNSRKYFESQFEREYLLNKLEDIFNLDEQ